MNFYPHKSHGTCCAAGFFTHSRGNLNDFSLHYFFMTEFLLLVVCLHVFIEPFRITFLSSEFFLMVVKLDSLSFSLHVSDNI